MKIVDGMDVDLTKCAVSCIQKCDWRIISSTEQKEKRVKKTNER